MIGPLELVEITGLALVIALSPVPVTGQLLLVLNNRTPWTPAAFVTGWAAALLALCGFAATGAALLLPGVVIDWAEVALLTLIVGVALVVAGILLWRKPPGNSNGERSRIGNMFAGLTPTRGLLIGVGYGALRPKNLLTAIAAGLIIGAGTNALWEGSLLVLYFSALGSATLAAPVLVYALGGSRTRNGMRRLQLLLSRYGNQITGSALAAVGVVVAGFGVVQLTS